MKYLVIIVVTAVLTLLAGWYATSFLRARAPATIAPLEIVPRWIGGNPCTEMNSDERAKELLVVQVLREFPRISTMHIAAERHLGRDQFRTVDKLTVRLCPASDLDSEIAELTLAQGTFARTHLFTEELWLARRLGPRDTRIVNGVAGTAFHPHPIPSDFGARGDIRTAARVILAEFGTAAAPWSEQAFQAINVDTTYGTTAAQIALAAGHPQAAAKISSLLEEILRKYPGDPVPRAVRNRFYELAFALARLGPDARRYAGPIEAIMSRKVQSWAPPFGMLALSPRRMCRVLELIGGLEAEKILTGDVCRPKIDTWEQ